MLRAVVFFNDTATTEIYTLSLHDALPISPQPRIRPPSRRTFSESPPTVMPVIKHTGLIRHSSLRTLRMRRSEEHTSELQSRQYLVCRLLLEKKKTRTRGLI